MEKCGVFIIADDDFFFLSLEYQLIQFGVEVKRIVFDEHLIKLVNELKPAAVILCCPLGEEDQVLQYKSLRSNFSGLLIHVADDLDINIQLLSLQLGADASWNIMDNVALAAANFQALLRKCGALDKPDQVIIGNLIIDRTKQEGFLDGKPVNLSTIEFHLLWLLAVRRGKVVSRNEIHRELYQNSYNGYDRSIDLYISRIRQKIGDNPQAPRYVKTIRGTGYLFILSDEKISTDGRSWN